jgi:hypothetical protein
MVIQSKQGMLHSHPVTPDFYSSSGSLSVFCFLFSGYIGWKPGKMRIIDKKLLS